MFDFGNSVVMVTGAAGNLGEAVSRAFLAARAQLVLVGRSLEGLERRYPELRTSPDHILASADLNDPASMGRVVEGVERRLARLDAVVNTVGGFDSGTPVHETPIDVWDSMMSLNARSAFVLSRAVVPLMVRQGRGRIIHVGARPGLRGVANAAAYSVSKSAVIRLTESLSAELRPLGVNVNCVIPGTLDTPQNRKSMRNANTARWVEPESVADVILFLASPAARDIHGASIPVYGRT